VTHKLFEVLLLMPQQLLTTGYSICQYGQIAHGAGRHFKAVYKNDPQDPVYSQQYAFVAQILLFPALAMSKISICYAYLRIFYSFVVGRRIIQVLIGVLILTIIPFDIEIIFQCKPIHVYWTEGHPASKCIDDLAGLFVNGTVNIVADVIIMAIVLPRVYELKLHSRQRWALIGVVLLGTLAVVAGIIRMVRVSSMLAKPDFDASWDSYDISIWTNTELQVSLICASCPGIKPVIVKFFWAARCSVAQKRKHQVPQTNMAPGGNLRRLEATSSTGKLVRRLSRQQTDLIHSVEEVRMRKAGQMIKDLEAGAVMKTRLFIRRVKYRCRSGQDSASFTISLQ
jgi:hypothetical protein